jgi:hypothetical protein
MPFYLKRRIQTYCGFLYKEKLFNISINFKLTTIYYVLSDDLHGHTSRPPGGYLKENKIYKIKLQLQLYFCVVRLRPDFLHFQYTCGNKLFKSIKYISDLS